MSHLETLSAAGSCFRLLSGCFYEPEKDLFQEQAVCDNLSLLLRPLSPEAADHAQKMAEELKSQEQQQLVIDYAALFIGPFELQAPPYGSVYLEKKREVMGETTMEVLKLYQDAGLQVEEQEPADHIAIELEFMSYLHDKESKALSDGTDKEAEGFTQLRKRFFSTCLSPWIPEFCQTMRNSCENQFYRALADCLAAFIRDYRQTIIDPVATV